MTYKIVHHALFFNITFFIHWHLLHHHSVNGSKSASSDLTGSLPFLPPFLSFFLFSFVSPSSCLQPVAGADSLVHPFLTDLANFETRQDHAKAFGCVSAFGADLSFSNFTRSESPGSWPLSHCPSSRLYSISSTIT